MNALATLIILVVTVGVVISGILIHRLDLWRQRDEQLAALEWGAEKGFA